MVYQRIVIVSTIDTNKTLKFNNYLTQETL